MMRFIDTLLSGVRDNLPFRQTFKVRSADPVALGLPLK
jgi:hypothetical protein